jgi:hypothetical protein
MGNNRRNWHRRWSIDLQRQTATHASGLVVQFIDRLIFPKPAIGTHCSAEGIGEWTGFLTGGDDALIDWMRQNPTVRDPASVRSRLERLMEEAGRVWAKAKHDALET